ncbi:MAG: hypothetical protein JW875_06785 [Spirochaetales bacterium]|nr:hypothetical protein [Spirochaetales bacterium]
MKKKFMPLLIIFILAILGSSCSLILNEDPSDSPLEVYDSFWNVLNRDYAGFYTKTYQDWTALRLTYRDAIINNPNDETLLSACTDIINQLNDGHMILFTGTQEITVYPDYTTIPFDLSVIQKTYLSQESWDASGSICTGFLPDGSYYMHVSRFSGEGWGKNFATELDRFVPGGFLIIDLRHNGGGNSEIGEDLLAQFVGESVQYGRDILHLGSDTTPLNRELWLHPAQGAPRQHRIVLLINETSASTTDMVIAAFQAHTEAFTIGKPTQAELIGNNLPRELTNGWVLRLGTVNNIMIGDTIVDGDIIPVDLEIDNTKERLEQGIDDQLEAALSWIQSQ